MTSLDQIVARAKAELASPSNVSRSNKYSWSVMLELATAVVEMADLRENDTDSIHNLMRDLDARTAQLATARKLADKLVSAKLGDFLTPKFKAHLDEWKRFLKGDKGL